MSTTKRLDMKLTLSIVLVLSFMASGSDFVFYDRRGLTEAAADCPAGAAPGTCPASAAPGGAPSGAPSTAGTTDASGATVFDVSKCPDAKSDGKTDMTAQVNKAWKDACQSKTPAKLLIPKGDWLVGELQFTGPCTAPCPITIEVQGTLKAKPDTASFPSSLWINVFQVCVQMMGGGTLHGQGELIYHNKKPGDNAFPDSIQFSQCPNSGMENINVVNGKGFNVKVVQSDNFRANLLNINCPEDSSNTDGIHIGQVKNVSITNSVIGVGDDCVSIGDDSVDVTVNNITCGPGHGISIGSLGRNAGEKDVKNIAISNCKIKDTSNGARIKSFHESPDLQASDIKFTDITVENVSNPIIIDQNYMSRKPGPSKVKISGVSFKNFKGSSATNVAVSLKCSSAVPCEGVELADLDFTYCGKESNSTIAMECENVKPTATGKMNPANCA